MALFVAAALAAVMAFVGAPLGASLKLKSGFEDCNAVVFDETNEELHVRTMVVENSDSDGRRQRLLVLVAPQDHSMPCRPDWWLEHSPQGVMQCKNHDKVAGTDICDARQCEANTDYVELGYVRTMLASTLFAPQQHTLSALCIELGCKTRIKRTVIPGALLEKAPEAQWSPRSRLRRALIIGLGTSTMAAWMRTKLPDTEVHVAELVPSVAAAASCFGLDAANASNQAKLHVHVGDGRGYLQKGAADGYFDAMIIDAFDKEESLPACFRTREFFQLVRQKLAPGGSVSFNLITGKGSLRVAKSLTSVFEASHVWVGQAPGAEGIQEVITAFAPGREVNNDGDPAGGVDSALPAAKDWFSSARYRPLRAEALETEEPFEDATECSGNFFL